MRYTYWLTQGPQFETVAEVNAIENLGGDMVGMTMAREAKLAAELAFRTPLFAFHPTGRRDETLRTAPNVDHQAVSAQANDRLDPVWVVHWRCR